MRLGLEQNIRATHCAYLVNPPGTVKNEVLFVAPRSLERSLPEKREANEARRAAADARPGAAKL